MRKFNFFCSVVLVITLAIFTITLAQNITLRGSATYTFYFNDTGIVDSVTDEYTNSQMSKEISRFMNSWRPEEFQVREDTGYDMQGIFDEKDSHNMLAVKKAADISLIIYLLSGIITVAIYVYFLKNGFKEVLRKRLKITVPVIAVLLACEMIAFSTKKGLATLMTITGVETLGKHSMLKTLLGGDFIGLAGNFLLGYTFLLCIIAVYLTLFLTKPPRIFY